MAKRLNPIIQSLTIQNDKDGKTEVFTREQIQQNVDYFCNLGFEYLFENDDKEEVPKEVPKDIPKKK